MNRRKLWMEDVDHPDTWQSPVIEDVKPTKYNWVVQHKDNLQLGYKTDIVAFTSSTPGTAASSKILSNSILIVPFVPFLPLMDRAGSFEKKLFDRQSQQHHAGCNAGRKCDCRIVGAHSFVNRDVADAAIFGGARKDNKVLTLISLFEKPHFYFYPIVLTGDRFLIHF